MSFRVTQRMISSRSLIDIRNNQLNMSLWRNQLSTGKRINKPSDDPTAFLRVLPIQNDITATRTFQDNAVLARDILNTASSSLEDATNLMAEARRIAIQGANGTMNAADRKTLASSANQLLGEMLSLANSKLGDRYLFGGTRTRTVPFSMTTDGLIQYAGDDDKATVEVAPGTETEITSSGIDVFMKTNRKATTFDGDTGAAAGLGTNSGTGAAILQIEQTNFTTLPSGLAAGSGTTTALGPLSFNISTTPNAISINGGPSVTFSGSETNLEIQTGTGELVYLDMSGFNGTPQAGFNVTSQARMSWDGGNSWTPVTDFTQTNVEVRNAQTGKVLYVDASGIQRAGKDQVTFGGTFDAFNSLVALRDLLNNTQNLSPSELSSRLTQIAGELDAVGENLIESLRDVGARSAQLDMTKNRMSTLELTLQEALSRDMDVDISEAILKLNQTDISFQASLQVGARAIQTSLLNFLG